MVKTAAFPSTVFWNTRILTTCLQQEKYIFPFNSRIDQFSSLLLRTCLHGGGEPQIGEVTYVWSPHLSCKRAQIKSFFQLNLSICYRIIKKYLYQHLYQSITRAISTIKFRVT